MKTGNREQGTGNGVQRSGVRGYKRQVGGVAGSRVGGAAQGVALGLDRGGAGRYGAAVWGAGSNGGLNERSFRSGRAGADGRERVSLRIRA